MRSTDLIVEEHSRAHILVEEDDRAERIVDAIVTPVAPARLLASQKWAGSTAITRPVIVVVAVLLIAVVVAGIYFWRARESAPLHLAPLRSIAVLPFKPLVASERDESFEIGMADTLISRLSSIKNVKVRPFSAVRRYTKLEDEVARAGSELNVDAVLDGSIQKSGDRVRVRVRLVKVEGELVI